MARTLNWHDAVLMKTKIQFPRPLAAAILLLVGLILTTQAADSSRWAGQYRDDKFLGDRAVFQLSIEQSGSAMQVSFDAAWDDAHGAAPEAQGPAKISGNTLTFTFEDSFGNSGTGTVKRAGNDILITINPTHVADARCLPFYGKNMRLKRAAKK
ncbi:MAG TPA: hypothetical protein VH188_03155 [Chthoniobacterales bacterium]|jgi:hypothetical protein|nr:hypothetical protein [Chthoniobacterales bacterium]